MNSIQFALAKIVTRQFAIIPDVYKANVSISVNFGLNFSFVKDQRLIACTFKINFLQKESTFLQVEVGTIFQIEENSWKNLLKDEEVKIVLPKQFAEHLGVLAVGTTRGVLHCKTENTEFNQFVLPTIDVKKLIEKDIEFTFKHEEDIKSKKD